MSFWDAVKADMSGEFFKFEAPGDNIAGTITDLEMKNWPDGGQSINITFEEEGAPRLGISNIMAKKAMFQLQPDAGDWIRVTYTGDTKSGTRTMKRFTVVMKRADGTTQTVEA